jgi:hypothetical protein
MLDKVIIDQKADPESQRAISGKFKEELDTREFY